MRNVGLPYKLKQLIDLVGGGRPPAKQLGSLGDSGPDTRLARGLRPWIGFKEAN